MQRLSRVRNLAYPSRPGLPVHYGQQPGRQAWDWLAAHSVRQRADSRGVPRPCPVSLGELRLDSHRRYCRQWVCLLLGPFRTGRSRPRQDSRTSHLPANLGRFLLENRSPNSQSLLWLDALILRDWSGRTLCLRQWQWGPAWPWQENSRIYSQTGHAHSWASRYGGLRNLPYLLCDSLRTSLWHGWQQLWPARQWHQEALSCAYFMQNSDW